MTKKEKTIQKIIALGGRKDEEIDNVYWLNGHCVSVKSNGEAEEL